MTRRVRPSSEQDVTEPDSEGSERSRHAGRAEAGRRVPSWIPVLAVVVAFFAVLAAGLTQPGGTIAGDVSEHLQLSEPLPQVAAGKPYRGQLVATQDDLAAVSVVFATYLDTIDCSLDIELTDADTGAPVASADDVDCDSLDDNRAARVLSFAPVPGSAERTYDLEVSLERGSGIGPSVWSTASGADAVLASYEPERFVLGHLDEVVDRLSAYGPAWGTAVGIGSLLVFAAAAMVVLLLRPRWGLAAVLVLALLRGMLWVALIPPLQGMDEGAHFASVQYMATEGRLPNRTEVGTPHKPYSDSLIVASKEMHVSALAPTDRPDYDPSSVNELLLADADAGTESDGAGPAAGYPPGYYAPAVPFYVLAADNTVDQVHAIRFWSVLLGVGAAALAWFFGREVFGRQRWAQAGLAVAVALQPMIAHQFAIVNNDAVVILAGFGALWIGAVLTRTARAPRLMLLAGAVVGLGLLGKPFVLAAVLPVAIGWVLGKIRYRVTGWRALLGEPLLAALGVAATYGLWLGIARVLGISTSNGFPTAPVADGSRGLRVYLATQYDPGFREVRGIWVNQFWGDFGWVNTPMPTLVYGIMWRFCLVVAAALVAWLVVISIRRLRTPEMAQLDRLIAVCAGFGLGTLALLYGIEFFYFQSSGRTDLLQGRYALMTVPALLALPGLLTARLSRGKWGPTVPTLVVAAGMFVLQAIAIAVVVRHFYL